MLPLIKNRTKSSQMHYCLVEFTHFRTIKTRELENYQVHQLKEEMRFTREELFLYNLTMFKDPIVFS